MRLPARGELTQHFQPKEGPPRGGLIPSPSQEIARLQRRVEQLEAAIQRLSERLAELELEDKL